MIPHGGEEFLYHVGIYGFKSQALEKFIKGYEGTIVFVSHDQAFTNNVADIQYQIIEKQLKRIGD